MSAGESEQPLLDGRLRFPKAVRLRNKREFDRVYNAKCKAADGVLLLFAVANELPHSRIGLSVSRKVGNAVVRNRVKRWLREAYRHVRRSLPAGYDFVAIPLSVERASFAEYCVSLEKLAAKLQRRLSRGGEATS